MVFGMRRFLTGLMLAFLAAGTGLYLFFHAADKRPVPSEGFPTTSSSPSISAQANQTSPAVARTPVARSENESRNSNLAATTLPSPVPFLLGSPDASPGMDPTTVLSNMRIVINQYGSMFGGNPVGSNPEITRALNGGNPKEVKFLSEESGLRINGRGELVDYWGTPFFFHQLSGTEMEIRSAGPDRKMWTSDDLVAK